MSDFVTPWTAACQASLSNTNSRSLLRLMSIESVMPSNHLILCCPLFLLPSIFPSIRVFSKESVLHMRWPKYWSFSFNISPSIEYLGLIFFRMDWLDLLAIQGTLKSLLQHHSSKTLILWYSAIFMVQLSHLYMTTGKTISLTIQTFVWKTPISYRRIKWLHLHFRKTTLAAVCWSDSFQLVIQLWPTVCDHMDCSNPGFPIHHQFPELAQNQVHQVSNTIQPSHLLCRFLLLPSIIPIIRVFTI